MATKARFPRHSLAAKQAHRPRARKVQEYDDTVVYGFAGPVYASRKPNGDRHYIYYYGGD